MGTVYRIIAAIGAAVSLTACASTGGLPTMETPPLIRVDLAEYNAGMPHVRAAIATRTPFRGKSYIALDIPVKGNLNDEFRLCYTFTYAVHSHIITQLGAGGFIQGVLSGIERSIDRSINNATVTWESALGAAAAGAIAGAHSAIQEEVNLFFYDVRQCTLRRTSRDVYIANVPGE